MFLITTADERTWPKDQPVLFLGEWCRLYSLRHVWAAMDAEMVSYHWNDRAKIHLDYLYLKHLYEELLLELVEKLNTIHGVDHSLRYWRILVGPWLGYFVQMLFDRWAMIQRAVTDYSIAGVRIIDAAPEQVVPNDMVHFNGLFIEDAWNEVIYGQLLQGWTTVPVEKVQGVERSNLAVALPGITSFRWLKLKLAHAAAVLSQIFARDDAMFFMASYLSITKELRLQWLVGQLPVLWNRIPPPRADVDWNKRCWQMGRPKQEGFSGVVRAMIPRHIPTVYLEGYAELQSLCDKLHWPKKPRLIFTSNSYDSDEVFKAWAAGKVEAGVPLAVGQHGGNYGVDRWNFAEDHECSISDSWLSWGWDDKRRPQIKPVGNLKMFGIDMHKRGAEGYALMVEMTMSRYSYRMHSVPMAGQWLDYFNEQCRFVDALPDEIRGRLLVRLYVHDCGWYQAARWREHFPEIQLDDGRGPIAPLIEKSRIYVSTYNATTYLESLAMNIPTIMFWNPNHWELRNSAVPYFERLKAVGIFHETPEAAAHQMTQVWDNVAAWWNSEPVQAAREEFCYRYSRMPKKPLEDLGQTLRQISYSATE